LTPGKYNLSPIILEKYGFDPQEVSRKEENMKKLGNLT
jgi:hypothetical protein